MRAAESSAVVPPRPDDDYVLLTRRDHGMPASVVLLVLAAAGFIAWTTPGAWLVIVAMGATAVLAWLAGWRGRDWRITWLAVGVFVAACDYLSWRFSVISWGAWAIGVPLYLAELHAAAQTTGMHSGLLPRAERREGGPRCDPSRMPVFVFVPTVDEGPLIVGQTVRGILEARDAYLELHPHAHIEVVVCNDGGVAKAACSDEIIQLARQLGVTCVTRTTPGGAKAGNLEHARSVVGAGSDSVLVIFDADQVPRPGFFSAVLDPMADPRVGWAQTGQFYRNRLNVIARWADDQQSLFYRLLCPSKSSQNAAFICGTNVAIRAAAIDEIGGMPIDSVTEDFAASIRLAHRWRSVYVPGVYATGLGPEDLPAYLKQQERWARGTLAALRDHWWKVLGPSRYGLTVRQRVQYSLALTHYLSGVRDLVFVVAPVVFVLLGWSGVRGATAGEFLQHFVPYYGLSLLAFWHVAWRTTSWRGMVMGFLSTPALVQAAWMTLTGRRGGFTLTPKTRQGGAFLRSAIVYLVPMVACVIALVVALTVKRGGATMLAAFWLLTLVVMFAICLWLVWQDSRAHLPASMELGDLAVIRSEDSGALPGGGSRRWVAAGLAVALAMGAAGAWFGSRRDAQPSAVAPPVATPGTVRMGLAGASSAQIDSVERDLVAPVSIIGRTAEIESSLDAGELRSRADDGTVVWLTLQLTKDNVCDYTCSLTAVRNGLWDEDFERWADDLRDAAVPVYLTVLPHPDRNYASSSAVARGGIPGDAPVAWERIDSIFGDAGAVNVSLVWTPGDALRDKQFRPNPKTYDAVAVTMFMYPNTVWDSPETMLTRTAKSHPGKQVLAVVSAAGAPRGQTPPPTTVSTAAAGANGTTTNAVAATPSTVASPLPSAASEASRTVPAQALSSEDTAAKARWLSAVVSSGARVPALSGIVYQLTGPATGTDGTGPDWGLPDGSAPQQVFAEASRRFDSAGGE